jgi:methionyl-tRNA formyltransferase
VRIFLLGGTDLTLAVADCAIELGFEIGGLAYVGERFDISYALAGVPNTRAVDVETWCAERGIPAHRYEDAAALEGLVTAGEFDLGLAAGWYHMIPAVVRSRFSHGCLGIHGSLLPRLRGGAPLNWAILSGMDGTGVTLFELGDGVDDGPVYGQRSFAIEPRATIGELVALAERATLDLVADVLPAVVSGSAEPVPQSGTPSYCLQRTPDDGRIDWRRSAPEIDRLIRAVGRPYPGARTTFDGRDVRIWAATPLEDGPAVYGAPRRAVRRYRRRHARPARRDRRG